MKRIFLTAWVSIIAVLAGAQPPEVTINGTAPDSVKTVYLFSVTEKRGENAADSAQVRGNRFTITRHDPKGSFLRLATKEGQSVTYITPPETTTIETDLRGATDLGAFGIETGRVTGGDSINRRFEECRRRLYAPTERFYQIYKLMKKNNPDDSLKSELKKAGDDYDEALRKNVYLNLDNIIPAYYISNLAYNLDYDELKALADKPFFSHPLAEGARRQLSKLDKERSSIGQPFTDLVMADTAGVTHHLSEYCGKGGYVLIDFWASWCGPCRQEMPNVKTNYDKYRSKGFNIVGLSLDSKKDAWTSAINNMNLPWVHLSDLKGWQSAAARVYSINSIPSSVLLDGNGKIIAFNLRGEALGEKLSDIYGY